MSLPTTSYSSFNLFSRPSSMLLLFNLPSKDLLINCNVLFTKLPHLPNNSPLIELINPSYVKLKSLVSGLLILKYIAIIIAKLRGF